MYTYIHIISYIIAIESLQVAEGIAPASRVVAGLRRELRSYVISLSIINNNTISISISVSSRNYYDSCCYHYYY